jgi:threonine synthase
MSSAHRLQCADCSATYEPQALDDCHACGGRLLVTYDFNSLRNLLRKEQLAAAPASMWRLHGLLPELGPAVTLGEGFTPLLPLRSLGASFGYSDLWLKDESLNPGGSFAARGTSVAVTAARAFGAAGFAAAASVEEASIQAIYAAAAGLKVHIFVPSDISRTNYVAAMAAGADVTLVDGSLEDCREQASKRNATEGWFDFAGVTEPYRIEGEKTVGFEIAAQLAWSLPDAVVLPAGGGEAALSKAFRELEQLGWIDGKRPRIVEIAPGTRSASMDAALKLTMTEGLFVSPEGGACIAALGGLLESGELKAGDRVVVLNPASGLKHIEAYGTRFIRAGGAEQDKLGGLILPR